MFLFVGLGLVVWVDKGVFCRMRGRMRERRLRGGGVKGEGVEGSAAVHWSPPHAHTTPHKPNSTVFKRKNSDPDPTATFGKLDQDPDSDLH